jgi:hypothetical protein
MLRRDKSRLWAELDASYSCYASLHLIPLPAAILTRFLSSAHDVALSKQHKSISASDVLKALEMIEFGDLVDKLQAELTGASKSQFKSCPCSSPCM